MPNPAIRAVLWDFGGVMTESPFLAFSRFEKERGLPAGFLRRINAQNHDHNAWARFERAEIAHEQFDEAFATETRSAGHEVRGLDVVDLLYGNVRPAMVAALKACKHHYTNACVTNNVAAGPGRGFERDAERAEEWKGILGLFELACEQLGITASQAVYLDDLGSNLKPARIMGMHTIKVEDPGVAIAALESVLAMRLR
jgi:putative hydrolase of the HAD superfamily